MYARLIALGDDIHCFVVMIYKHPLEMLIKSMSGARHYNITLDTIDKCLQIWRNVKCSRSLFLL